MPTVWSSNGYLSIDAQGNILDFIPYVGGSLPHITRFDTAEFISTYGKLDDDIDILDIGCWYVPDTTFRQQTRIHSAMTDAGVVTKEVYEPAEPDFRKGVQECFANPDLC